MFSKLSVLGIRWHIKETVHPKMNIQPFYRFFQLFFLHFKLSPHLLQLLLKNAANPQNDSDYKTSPDFPSVWETMTELLFFG